MNVLQGLRYAYLFVKTHGVSVADIFGFYRLTEFSKPCLLSSHTHAYYRRLPPIDFKSVIHELLDALARIARLLTIFRLK